MTKSTKRRSESMAGDYTPYSKRARPMAPNVEEDSLMAGIERPRVDARTGLRNAFPGLDDDDGGELFYGPATDGLEYLRMVR